MPSVPYPPRRRGPNRRDRWKAQLATSPSVPPACRLFCVNVLAKHMNASGIVSVPRYRLAHQANVSERRVTQFITQAKEGGWLVVVQAGYRTMTAVYQATFPDSESGNRAFPLSTGKSGKDASPLSAGRECSRITEGKREESVPASSTYTGTRPETAIFPQYADGPVPLGFEIETKSKKNPTTHLRAV